MYRMFYRGQYIGNARNFNDGWIACFINGDERIHAYHLKNKGAAKSWLIDQYLKFTMSQEAA